MNIELDESQVELLREILDISFRDLRYEIADTGRGDFKRQLKDREVAIRTLLDLVGGPLPDG